MQTLFLVFLAQTILANQSFAQHSTKGMLGLLGDIADAHAEAVASLDLKNPSFKYSGSASDEKDHPKAAENLGILISEGVLFGRGAHSVFNEHRGGLFFAEDGLGGAMDPEPDVANIPSQKKPLYFYLSEELEFVVKSANSTFGGGGNTTTTTLNYLQLPVLFNYLHPLNNNTAAIHAGLGVYFAYALSGKYKNNGQTQDIHLGSSADDDFKRSDFGTAINVGYNISNKWDAFINYDIGIKNLSNQAPDPNIRIRGFSINVGYTIF